MRDKISRVLRNGSWVAASQVFSLAVRFISLPLLLAFYGRDNYGLIAIVGSVQTYLGILSLGTPDGLVKHAAEWIHRRNNKDLYACARTMFTFYIFLGILSALVLTALAISCAGIFHISAAQKPLLRNMFMLTAGAILLLPPTQLITQLLKAAEEFHFLGRCSMVQSVLELLWVLGAVFWQVRLDCFLGVRLVVPLVIVPFLIWRWSRHGSIGGVLGLGWDWAAFQPVLKYGCAMLAMGWCYTTFTQMRQVILGARSTVAAAAEFSIVLAMSNVLMMASSWIVGPLVPSMAKALAGGEEDYVKFVAYRMTKYFGILLSLPGTCLIVNADSVLGLYVGKQYVALAPSLIIMVLCVIDTFLAPLSGIIFASGKLRPYVWSNAIFGMGGLVLVWLLAPRYGTTAAVLATVFYYTANMIFQCVYYIPVVMKLDALRMLREAIFRPVAAAAFAALVMLVVKTAGSGANEWIRLGTTVAAGVPCYVVAVWLISLNASERVLISGKLAMLRKRAVARESLVG